jgi:hypothetical protein
MPEIYVEQKEYDVIQEMKTPEAKSDWSVIESLITQSAIDAAHLSAFVKFTKRLEMIIAPSNEDRQMGVNYEAQQIRLIRNLLKNADDFPPRMRG